MSTVRDRIAEADRQIERMRLRIEQQRAHAENLRWDQLSQRQKRRAHCSTEWLGSLPNFSNID